MIAQQVPSLSFCWHNVYSLSVDDKEVVIDLYSNGATKLEKGVAVTVDKFCEQGFGHDVVWVGSLRGYGVGRV